ncbi:MAG: galactokinase [Acidimicrobiia bacterium]|nr:galactokinase [Acidimicrobiia bacterium]
MGRSVTARAPGRVNLIGEHTDYNDGFVLPLALPFETVMLVKANEERVVRLESEGFPSARFALEDDPRSVEPWARYVAGMVSLLTEEGIDVPGFDAWLTTTIPVGASLSSSAALEVATGFAVCALVGVTPDPVVIARLGQRVENEIVGIQSGIMDQLISAIATKGAATMIDCRSLDTQAVLLPEHASVVIMDTMTRRELADSEYDRRRAACERVAAALGVAALRDASIEDVESLPASVDKQRAMHVVTENQRVLDAVEAFGDGDLQRAGDLMNSSHASLSSEYEVSSAALDEMASIARSHPACFGARMTGGGFAGSAVALIDASMSDSFVAHVRAQWELARGVCPDVWAVTPQAGASVSPVSPA